MNDYEMNEIDNIIEFVEFNKVLNDYGTKIEPPQFAKVRVGMFGVEIFLSFN